MTVTHAHWCGKFYDIPPGKEHDSADCFKSKAERDTPRYAITDATADWVTTLAQYLVEAEPNATIVVNNDTRKSMAQSAAIRMGRKDLTIEVAQ